MTTNDNKRYIQSIKVISHQLLNLQLSKKGGNSIMMTNDDYNQ